MTWPQVLFATFGLASQGVLLAYFGARWWAHGFQGAIGLLAYAVAGLGAPLAAVLYLDGQPWTLVAGPLLTAAWAAFGGFVDIWRPRQWRASPVDWSVLVPYAGLFVIAQMFMWWPLWEFARGAWLVFLVLFVANTALNLRGHIGATRDA